MTENFPAVVKDNALVAQNALKQQLAVKQDEIDDIIAEISPVLNLIDPETGKQDRQLTGERLPSTE